MTQPTSKNGQPHKVPLCLMARNELAAARVGDAYAWTGMSGFSSMKKRWDRLSSVSGWVVHDLRRSMATHLAEEGFEEGVVDRMLNHMASGSSTSSVARVYNRAKLLDAREKAAWAWAERFIDVGF